MSFAVQVLVCLQWVVVYDIRFQSTSNFDTSKSDSDFPESLSDLSLDESEVQLAQALWKLLHQLLTQQLSDHSLDMQDILSVILLCATSSLSQRALSDFPPFTELLEATLRRIMQDKTQHEPDPEVTADEGGQTYQRFMVFWSFLSM